MLSTKSFLSGDFSFLGGLFFVEIVENIEVPQWNITIGITLPLLIHISLLMQGTFFSPAFYFSGRNKIETYSTLL